MCGITTLLFYFTLLVLIFCYKTTQNSFVLHIILLLFTDVLQIFELQTVSFLRTSVTGNVIVQIGTIGGKKMPVPQETSNKKFVTTLSLQN